MVWLGLDGFGLGWFGLAWFGVHSSRRDRHMEHVRLWQRLFHNAGTGPMQAMGVLQQQYRGS